MTFNIINLDKKKFENQIINKDNPETFGNLASLLQCFITANEEANDLIFFVEDDYLHEEKYDGRDVNDL